jgi:hypothetical protein
LPVGASFRDVLLAVRADEAVHREVNHELSEMDQDMPLVGEEIHF